MECGSAGPGGGPNPQKGKEMLKITETTEGVWCFHEPDVGVGQSKYVVYRYNSGNFKCDTCLERTCPHIQKIKTMLMVGALND